jgi:uncharacterized protein (TIGR02996 family)
MSNQTEQFFRTSFPDAQESALLEGVLAHPDDLARRLIYADWLEEQGGRVFTARAEFLRAQEKLKTSPGANKKLRGQIDKLRPRVGWEWLSVLGDTRERLRELEERTAEEWGEGWNDFLAVTSERGLLDIHFHGTQSANYALLGEETGAYDELCEWLTRPDLAAVLRSVRLEFCGDRGYANGTCRVRLDWFSQAPVEYPWLTAFAVDRDYRGMVIHDYSEEGAIGRLLRKCRALERLEMPSAPNATFFEGGPYPLKSLALSAGYATEQFLLHLSNSTCFPDLRHLEFKDYAETYVAGWEEQATPFEHYQAFFRSPVMAQLETVVLRPTALSKSQIGRLRRIRKEGVTIQTAKW